MPHSYTKNRGKRVFPEKSHYLFNVDTFWYNIDVENYDEIMDLYFRSVLVDGKDHLEEYGLSKPYEIDLPYYETKLSFDIEKGQPPLYYGSLRNNDVAIYFSKFYPKGGKQYPIKVQINQEILWEKGLKTAVTETREILHMLGFSLGNGRVNRIDLACHSDQWQWNLYDVRELEYPRNFSKTNFPNFYSLNPFTLEFETMTIGTRHRLFLRIYNKSRLQEKQQKQIFKDLYEKNNMDVDSVWNIEFECGREYLKTLQDSQGVHVFNDLDYMLDHDKLSVLWNDLMKNFNHTSAHWTQLSKGDKNRFQQTDEIVSRKKINDYSLDREVAQIRGRLMKFLIWHEDNEVEHAMNEFLSRMVDYEKEKNKSFSLETMNKKKRYMNEMINSLSENKKNATENNDDITPYDFM